MRQSTLAAAAGIAFAALLSSAPAMAQAYNTDLIGWNRGGAYIATTTGNVQMCFKGKGGKFNGPPLQGKSDAATHGWQNFWGPCADNASAAAKPQQAGAQTARR
jgi:hypothetical protein